jgi:hypothetical protein
MLVPELRRKWLNVVFDLNGVLCESEGQGPHLKKAYHQVHDNIFSDRVPTIIGTKAVFVRPNVREFLEEVSRISHRVVVWSSMMKKTVEPVASFLFQNCRAPFDILGQDNCRRIEITKGKYLKQAGSPWKDLFLKVLDEQLFVDPDDPASFNKDNTILIDDSPQKAILNENGNGVFLDSWSHHGRGDKVLMGSLAPWLRRVHEDCPIGRLAEFVDANRIGVPPMCPSDDRAEYILVGLRELAKKFGSRFVLPGWNVVIEPKSVSRKK